MIRSPPWGHPRVPNPFAVDFCDIKAKRGDSKRCVGEILQEERFLQTKGVVRFLDSYHHSVHGRFLMCFSAPKAQAHCSYGNTRRGRAVLFSKEVCSQWKAKEAKSPKKANVFEAILPVERELFSKTQKSLAGHGAFVYIIKALSGVFGPLAQLVRACA